MRIEFNYYSWSRILKFKLREWGNWYPANYPTLRIVIHDKPIDQTEKSLQASIWKPLFHIQNSTSKTHVTPIMPRGMHAHYKYHNDFNGSSVGRCPKQSVIPSKGRCNGYMHQSSERNIDGNPLMLLWGANNSVQDINQEVPSLFTNYREYLSYLEVKCVHIV